MKKFILKSVSIILAISLLSAQNFQHLCSKQDKSC